MARGELLSVLGLYQFDNTLFDEIVLPNEINKDVLIENILLDCAELEIVYPSPNVMKSAIGIWSKSRIKSWNDMKNVLIVENYRPFINLERKEKGYDLETRNLKTKGNDTSNSTTNSSIDTSSNSSSTQTQDSTTTDKISAFNSSNFENKEQSIVDNDSTTNIENSEESSETITNASTNNSNLDNTGTIKKDYEHTFEGDSAMFTKQNIIEQEMEMRLKYDLYKIIIDEFKKKFCLLIY